LFEKVLIANRGEIALRVARACRELGIKSVAVYSTADAESAVVKFADEAVQIGPPAVARSYLHIPSLIGAALKTGYEKVFWTIFDGHVTALVAGFVIRYYGSGPVRGFATTLIIGLLASMFTSNVVTRAIVEWFVSHGRLHKAVSF